jgi:RNA polymerase sigma factor (sigma-70 family)
LGLNDGHNWNVKDLAALADEELWALAASRDGDAFGELFERHADAVYNHCFRRTGSWSVAEDLTSVVFLEAWRRRRQVEFHGESVLPWFLAVANNAIRNSDRSIRRYRRLLSKLPRPTPIPDQSEEAIGRVDDERTMRNVLEAFNRLSAQDQEIVSLCDWTGLGYEDAAMALGVPIGTIRSRLSRARARLREHLGQTTGPIDINGDDSTRGES